MQLWSRLPSSTGEVSAPPWSTSVLLTALGLSPPTALGLPPFVARGLPSLAPLGLPSTFVQEFSSPAAQGFPSSPVRGFPRPPLIDHARACCVEAPSCSVEGTLELHRRPTTRSPWFFTFEWSGHHQVRCCPVCKEQQSLSSSSSRLAHLPLPSSPRLSPTPWGYSPSDQR